MNQEINTPHLATPCMCMLWGKLGVRTTPEIIHVQQRQTHTFETDSVEGGSVRSEGVRVRILAFCVDSMGESVPRSVPLNMDSWDFCPFFTARSLFSSTSHTAADFARQVD